MNYLSDFAIKSTIVALVGLVAAQGLRRGSASARHFVLLLTLIGVALLPLAMAILPAWHAPFLHVTRDAVEVGGVGITETAQPTTPFPVVPVMWGVVSAFFLLRTGLGLGLLRWRRRNLRVIEDPIVLGILSEATSASIQVYAIDVDESPMIWGFRRPCLLLPEDCASWPHERLRSVIYHEIAHLERQDWLVCLLSQAVCAVLWFQPLLWVLNRKLFIESERAADDRVLERGMRASQYASHLLEVVASVQSGRRGSSVALMMAKPGSLDGRVRSILAERACRKPVRGTVAVALVMTTGTILGVIAAAAPTAVHSFEATQVSTPPAPKTEHFVAALRQTIRAALRTGIAASVAAEGASTQAHRAHLARSHAKKLTDENPKVSTHLQPTASAEQSVDQAASTMDVVADAEPKGVDNIDSEMDTADAAEAAKEGMKEYRQGILSAQKELAEARKDVTRELTAALGKSGSKLALTISQKALRTALAASQKALKQLATDSKKGESVATDGDPSE